MSRTESISIQVHPNDEQEQINLMQKFHWSLINSQEIKNIDNHLERRGDDIYQVTNSEHYIKLTFSRALDLPNLTEIKRLEEEFYDIPYPQYPRLFPGTIWLWLFLSFFWGLGIVGWVAYYFLSYKPKKEEADRLANESQRKMTKVLTEVEKYD